MKTRLIIHYSDGKTFIGDWNTKNDFSKLDSNPISSVQIQTSNYNSFTLSSRKKQSSTFWNRESSDLVSILKRIHKNVWIDLSINRNTEERSIDVINENIRIK